jgi:hypothetical protein
MNLFILYDSVVEEAIAPALILIITVFIETQESSQSTGPSTTMSHGHGHLKVIKIPSDSSITKS